MSRDFVGAEGLDAQVLMRRFGRSGLGASLRLTDAAHGHAALWAERHEDGFRLAGATSSAAAFAAMEGETQAGEPALWRGPASASNIAALRAMLPSLQPRPLGPGTSAGFGDRLGLATPGHVDAMRASGAEGQVSAIFAQQSMRENTRTGRSPREVLDDATLGAFVAGWRGPVGADADHLKTEADIDLCLDAGYSFFTLDPGDAVDDSADDLQGAELSAAYDAMPAWAALDSSPSDLATRLGGHRTELADRAFGFAPGELERAAVKYGPALALVARLARHLRSKAGPERAEIEVSVDETNSATTPAQHLYLALEMRRLGVDFVSLAPRFVGGFEKGVDYQGDLSALAEDVGEHAAICLALGGYKLSLHSGSDKFMVYPLAAATGAGLHLKTAGTSYLEALRVVGMVQPKLLHKVVDYGFERFEEDVRSYHVSVSLQRIPRPRLLPGRALTALLEQHDGRQMLHVTFGSALRQFGDELRAVLRAHPAAYRAALRRHFERHLAPLLQPEAANRSGEGPDLGGAP